MKRVGLPLFVLLLLIFVHQAVGNSGPLDALEFLVFEENGKVGLKDEQGHVLIPAEYESIGWSNGKLSIVDKVVGYRLNGLWGLISTSNKVVTPAEFIAIQPAEGSLLVAQKESPLSRRPSFGLITTAGRTIIPFLYDALQVSNMRAIVMSRIGTRYLFGLTDLSHRIVIPVQYRNIYSLGSLRYAVENFENKTAIFSEEGTQLTPFDIDSISPFKKDFAVVYQDQRQGIINRSGQFVAKPLYGEIRISDDGDVLTREFHEVYFLKGDNTVIREFRADDIRPLSVSSYAIYRSGKLQLVNNDLAAIHTDYLSDIGEFKNSLAVFTANSHQGVIASDGRIVIPAQYRSLASENPGVFRACLVGGNRWTIIDAEGKPLTEKQYEHIAPFTGKFYPVKSRGYWGALDADGRELIACVHDSLLHELKDNIAVKFKGQYGVMNLRGQWVVTPRQNPIKLLDENHFFEYADSTTYLRSFDRELIYFSSNPLEFDGGYIRERLSSGAYWTVDLKGIVIDRSNQPVDADEIFPESEGLRAIRRDGKFGFIDKEGRLRIANRYELVKPFSNGLAAVRIRGRWGFINREERLVIQPIYDHVENFDNGMAIVGQDGKFGVIDPNGKVVLPLRYDEIVRNQNGRYVLRLSGAHGLADASGTISIHPKYDNIKDVGNGFVIVERGGKYGVLTLKGISTIPLMYDNLSFDSFHDQFVAIKHSQLTPLPKK